MNDNLEMVSLFIEHNAEINLTTKGGHTALHIAINNIIECDEEASKIASLLISKGADIYAKNKDVETPLDLLDRDLEGLKVTFIEEYNKAQKNPSLDNEENKDEEKLPESLNKFTKRSFTKYIISILGIGAAVYIANRFLRNSEKSTMISLDSQPIEVIANTETN